MPQQPSTDILQRLLVVKHLLAANSDQLMPSSDAAAVARMVLVAHDAAELAIAAIASHLNVPGLTERMSLTEYAPKIEAHTQTTLSGADFLKSLNQARIGFKHHGVMPDARQWYRVIDNAWTRLDDWCHAYLDVALDDIDLEEFLADDEIKVLYEFAKRQHAAGRYREALEALGHALYRQLRHFPGMHWPTVGKKNTEDALMLAPFGVRPSDFLTLQDFLPRVYFDWAKKNITLKWESRVNGHEGNWTEANVRFCLDTFLDLALKIQHAPSIPRAIPFDLIFDDVITPKNATAELFEWTYERSLKATLLTGFGRPTGRSVVRVLEKGETLRCRLSPAKVTDKVPSDAGLGDLASLGTPEPTIHTAEVLTVHLPGAENSLIGQIMYVDRASVEVGTAPKDDDFVRRVCPHLFGVTEGELP
jgi:hypothetical protein